MIAGGLVDIGGAPRQSGTKHHRAVVTCPNDAPWSPSTSVPS
jgi:hypothetical protein